MSTSVHIGKKVKELRKSQNMTQQELAEGIVTRGFISQLEKGLVSASIDTLEKLAKRLHCDTSYLLSSNQHAFAMENDDMVSLLDTIESYIDEKNFDLARRVIERIPTNVISHLSASEQGHFLWAKAYLLWEEKDFIQARNNVLKSIDLFELSHDQQVGKSYNLLGIIDFHLKKPEESLHAFTKAMYFSTKYPSNIRLRVESLLNLGVLHSHFKEYTSATYYLLEAESLNLRTDFLYKSGEIHMTLGVCYRNLGEWDKAEQYYEKAISVCGILEDNKLLGGVLTNLGVLHKTKKEYLRADQYLNEASTIYFSLQEEKLLLNTQMELLEVLIFLKKWREAKEIAQKLADSPELTPKQQGNLWFFKGKTEWLMSKGEQLSKGNEDTPRSINKLADEYFAKAEEIFKQSNLTSSLSQLYKELGQLNYDIKDYQKSSNYYLLYFGLQDC
jgi:transcriptional regulator with XRE-family HTH domain